MARGYYYSEPIMFPDDVKILKEKIPELRCFHDSVVDSMYSDFSQTWYCAGWMNLALESDLAEFRIYLFGDEVS